MADRPEIPAFSLDVRPGPDGRTTVAATGELDISVAPSFSATITEQLGAGPVLLDLSGLSFMDSSGVAALERVLRASAREGWDLRVARELDRPVVQVLEITGMLPVLPFADERPA